MEMELADKSPQETHPASGTKDVAVPWQIRFVECLHPRLHFGLLVLAIAAVTNFIAAVGATFGLGFFMEKLMLDLEVSRSVVSLCWTIALLVSAALLPLVGRAVDKFGVRKVMFSLIIPYTLSLVWLSNVHDPISMAFSFFLLRFFMAIGQLTVGVMINIWWVKYRGKAVGVMNAVAASALTFPSIQTGLDGLLGWRGALMAEAVMVAVIHTLAALLSLNHPERYNRYPDGARGPGAVSKSQIEFQALPSSDALVLSSDGLAADDDHDEEATQHPERSSDDQPDNEIDHEQDHLQNSHSRTLLVNNSVESTDTIEKLKDSVKAADEEVHWHWKDALRTPQFWVVATCGFFDMLIWSGFNFHYSSILDDMNLSPDIVHFIFVPIAVSSSLGMLGAGFLYDRFRQQTRVMAIAPLLAGLSTIVLFFVSNQALAVLFGLMFGSFNAIHLVGFGAIFGRLFGRLHLGLINSVATSMITLGIGIGPSIFGVVRESTGSYVPMFAALGGVAGVMTVVLFFMPPPRLPSNHEKQVAVIA